jgi:hypothetical protein
MHASYFINVEKKWGNETFEISEGFFKNMYHHPYTYQIQKYINIQQMHFNIYDVVHSQYSHQHVSAGIPAIFRVMVLLQEHSFG